MSLINQMLRDLESRRAQAQGSKPSGALDNLSWPSKPGMPSGNVLAGLHSVNWLRLGGITAAFAVLLLGYLWYSRDTPPDAAPLTVAQAPAPAVPAQPAAESGAEGVSATQQAAPADTAIAATEAPATAVTQPAEAAPPREPARAERQAAAPHVKKPSAQGPEQLAERGYQEAVEALQNGKVADAQQSLREALAQEPRHHKSRELLTEIYLRTGQVGEAENLLAAGAMLDSRDTLFSKLHARLLAQRGDISGALQVLQRGLTGAAGDRRRISRLARRALPARRGSRASGQRLSGRAASGAKPGRVVDGARHFAGGATKPRRGAARLPARARFRQPHGRCAGIRATQD
ncbi:MAG: tetratricopeptide repeat protein [Gammaproteobacteria bacterium]|nr:tetratricopeptide repeat protein [Gammaproteobacteria bacterium]